ncbi:MAG: hypothetical protein ABIQ41_09540 [Gemmatimonadales bacterium]
MGRKPALHRNTYTTCGTRVEITIPGNEKVVVIDAQDEPAFRRHAWAAAVKGNIEHVLSGPLYAHHLVIGKAPVDKVVRHINNDRFDLRRANLEFASKATVMVVSRRHKNNTTGVMGVNKNGVGFMACVQFQGVRHTRYFKTLDPAKLWREKTVRTLLRKEHTLVDQ